MGRGGRAFFGTHPGRASLWLANCVPATRMQAPDHPPATLPLPLSRFSPLQEFSQWPTFPQLYAGGELLGGCDIVLEMAEAGELAGELAKAAGGGGSGGGLSKEAALRQRLESLVNQQPVMLFMKVGAGGCRWVLVGAGGCWWLGGGESGGALCIACWVGSAAQAVDSSSRCQLGWCPPLKFIIHSLAPRIAPHLASPSLPVPAGLPRGPPVRLQPQGGGGAAGGGGAVWVL